MLSTFIAGRGKLTVKELNEVSETEEVNTVGGNALVEDTPIKEG
jgi:hypothetical protein